MGTGGPGRLGAVRTWTVWAGVSTEDRGQRRPPLLLDRERGGQQGAVRTVLLLGGAPEVLSPSDGRPQLTITAQPLSYKQGQLWKRRGADPAPIVGMAILCILCYPPIEAYQITGVVIGRGVLCEHVSLLHSSWFPDTSVLVY